jgi:predicted dithiol-disulfide oxidoreductase (DUF899 family)
MGYRTPEGRFRPGVSVFRKEDGKLLRFNNAGFQPFDDFSTGWHILDMFPEGAGAWGAKFKDA